MINKGLFQVNGATILKTDIECDNGVIHIIDRVLIPSSGGDASGKDSEVTKATPAEMIEQAIDRGVPIFNDGDPAACAEIYRACLEQIARDERVETHMRMILAKVLKHTKSVESDSERAWIYRGTMDQLYQHLED